jgi:hypothetical protein
MKRALAFVMFSLVTLLLFTSSTAAAMARGSPSEEQTLGAIAMDTSLPTAPSGSALDNDNVILPANRNATGCSKDTARVAIARMALPVSRSTINCNFKCATMVLTIMATASSDPLCQRGADAMVSCSLNDATTWDRGYDNAAAILLCGDTLAISTS